MVYSVQQIKYEILAYIKEFGGDFSDYYIGIAADPKTQLFGQHNVDTDKDPWLYKQALTFNAAKTIQSYFLDKLGADGVRVEHGDEDMDCVYVYKKSERTDP